MSFKQLPGERVKIFIDVQREFFVSTDPMDIDKQPGRSTMTIPMMITKKALKSLGQLKGSYDKSALREHCEKFVAEHLPHGGWCVVKVRMKPPTGWRPVNLNEGLWPK